MTQPHQHRYVMHTLTPVSVLPDAAGEPIVFVDPDDKTEAEGHAVYGCTVCDQPLNEAAKTACPGGE